MAQYSLEVKRMNDILLSFLDSEPFVMVRRRIFRQLIQSLIYEGMIHPEQRSGKGGDVLILPGRDREDNRVEYHFRATRTFSFERICLSSDPVKRVIHGEEKEAESLTTFLYEIAPFIHASEAKLSLFIDEINQTLLKDTIAQCYKREQPAEQVVDYDELEGDIMDGHLYHPCYKSRIGFTLKDHTEFGPEFKPRLTLVWVAIQREEARLSVSHTLDYASFIQQELGADYEKFMKVIQGHGKRPEDYVIVPVHPWQWRHVIMHEFFEQIQSKRMICLGEGTDEYCPQQSIRTLANASSRTKSYVKLPLSITNTSTSRILGQHTIINAARISDWLGKIMESDSYLREELRLVLLKEVMGVSYHHQGLVDVMEQKVYGVLGAIWRESLYKYLEPGETAIPFNALCHLNADKRPFIDSWIQQAGLRKWLKRMFEISVLPLIHLLYAHGVAMESHAQNMILIMREGIPERIALKDFHDGIRYSPAVMSTSIGYPQIEYPSANHPRINRNSFIEKEDPSEIKDFLHDAFFFINLSEFALFLKKHYRLSEQDFWEMVADVIAGYQQRFSHLRERFYLFDLFTKTIEVEQLTKRRLFDDTGVRVHAVKNPLYMFQTKLTEIRKEVKA
ncbi:IucA/IucC family protein [Aneurinibacillus thermoaerophilus]|nr:IucA/IucC family protein [Aneurinibacillus thermoaerophilus]